MLAQSALVGQYASMLLESGCLHMKDAKKVAAAEARAKALQPSRRSEIAKNAAEKRWASQKTYTAIEAGNFEKEFGIDVACYVLNDPNRTAVISQRGMGEAIGFSRRGSRLKVFASSQTMEGYIGRDLREKIENPLMFQTSEAAAESSVAKLAYGYDAAILIDLCKAIIEAHRNGELRADRYKRMVQQATIIDAAAGKLGIKNLVYALAGYNPTRDEVIQAFKLYVSEEAKRYESEFPNELYLEWHRLYNLPVPERGKPWLFKHLTVTHVYHPLAQSSGKILTLLRALRASDGDRKKKLFQFLNEIGARALRMHLGRVLEMAESSGTQEEYEARVRQRFGEQKELDLIVYPTGAAQPS
jgi:hypothetical protein